MRKFAILTGTIILFLFVQSSFAQVGVGTTTPNQSAALDVTATNKGVLLPRVALTAADVWAPLTNTPTEGMMVYNTATAGAGLNTVTPGFYYWYQSAWKPIGAGMVTGSATFNCNNIAVSSGLLGTGFTNGASYTGTITIPYTGGDGGSYPPAAQIINGLTFLRTAGTLANGSGQITYNVSGTYTGVTGSTETFVMNLPGANCSITLPASSTSQFSNLNCQVAVAATGVYELGRPIAPANASKTITVTPLIAGPYTITTNTVAGITFIGSGSFSAGQVGIPQSILLEASGTPTASGIRTFIVTAGAQACTFTVNVTTGAAFNCAGVVSTLPQGVLVSGDSYSGTVSLPYTAGSGSAYPAASITSNGLTLSRTAGTYAVGGGTVEYTLSGTYAGAGGAITFTLPESGCVVYMGAAVLNFNSLGCGGVLSGTYAKGVAMVAGNTKSISYYANTIGYYTISTNTVNGVSFAVSGFINTPGQFNTNMVASGTPIAPGTFTYTVTMNGQACTFTVTFTGPATFNCNSVTNTFTGNFVNGDSYNATITQPYSSGNGSAYGPITIGPVNGLTLAAPAGTYAAGGGAIVYTLSGIYTGATDNAVSFFLPESGCTVTLGNATYVTNSLVCSGILSGVYTVGIPMNASNTKLVTVNVATTGAYSITTSTSNGIFFTGSGIFTTTGPQTIMLTANGTPTSAGGPNFTVSSGGLSCSFNVTVTSALSILCGSASNSLGAPLVNGQTYNGTITVPYVAGNGLGYGVFSSGPSNGLMISRVPGTYDPSGGNVVYTVTGTYTGPNGGNATFNVDGCGNVTVGQVKLLPSSLSCSGALAGIFRQGISSNGNTKAVSFVNTVPLNQNIATNNINGISFAANINIGTTGSQTVNLIAGGTPQQFGTFTYTLTIDGQTCTFPVTFLPAATVNCGDIINGLPTPPLVSGTSYTGTVTVPYTAGNGQAYGAISLNSNGLTLNRVAGTYAVGGGNVVYNIGGTYTGAAGFVSYTIPENNCIVSSGNATVATLTCGNPPGGAFTVGVPMTNANIKFVSGNALNGGPLTISTNTVNGVSFSVTINATANATFNVNMIATGTPIAAGTFNYTVTAGSQTCNFPITFVSPVSFNCSGITSSITGALTNGASYTGQTITVPYTGGNGAAYPASSIGPVSGLTLNAPAGTYAGAGGSVVYTISGTYTGTTNASLTINFPESGCSTTLGLATFNPQTISCNGLLSGTYQNQVAVTAANTKVITIDVATTGAYSFTTNTVVGITFSASGVFNSTGVQPVTLVASGTVAGAGTVPFNVTGGGQTCQFIVPVLPSVSITCSGIVHTLPASLTNGSSYSGTVTVPYTSNGLGTYATTTVTSNGLTLTRVAGSYAASGNIIYNLSGTFTGTTGSAINFTLPDGGCVVSAGGSNFVPASLSCTPPAAGSYVQSVPLTSANTKTVTINVINPGIWVGSTNTVNGVTFTGSGNFGNGGTQPAMLIGSGTPAASGTFTYTVTLNGQTCNFDITYGTAATSCSGIVNTMPTILVNGNTYNTGGVSVPYSAGSNTPYTTTAIGPNQGLTLTRVAGTYNTGGGTIVYNLSGVYSGPLGGTVSFSLPEGCGVVAGLSSANSPDCSGALSGTYAVGVSMNPANTKTINVNFINPGNYNFVTSNVNGVAFNAQGYVSSAGVNAINFTANGVPSAAGTFTYQLNIGGQTCSFNVTFQPGADFDCGAITGIPVAQVVQGAIYSATIAIPYTSGNGSSYTSNNLLSGGVALARTAGVLSPAGGTVVYTMSGVSNNSSSLLWTLPESGCVVFLGNILYGANSLVSGPLAGTYTSGVVMTPSNTKTISINVTGPGNYSIISSAVNGVTFAGGGFVGSTGVKDIVLTATGTPASPGTYYYNVTVGGQSVNFGVTYQ